MNTLFFKVNNQIVKKKGSKILDSDLVGFYEVNNSHGVFKKKDL